MTESHRPPTAEQRKQGMAALFDRASATYDAVGVEFFTAFGRRLVEHVGLRPGEVVLDAGCGRGAATFAAADAVGRDGRVIGIDISHGMVERTAAEARERGLDRVEVRVGDAEDPDFPPGTTFDAVLSALVIFFLPDPLAAIRRYRALLPEGGRLGLTTFPPQDESRWSRLGKVFERFLPQGAVTARPDTGPLSSPEALAEALRANGFSDVRTSTEVFDTEFRDADHWWEWAWSHGQRFALERIPPEQLDDVRAELYGILAEEPEPDGRLLLRQRITYTVGVV